MVTSLFVLILSLGAAPLFAEEPAAKIALPPAFARPTVIIPYDPARDMQQAERVFLPLEKFRELWNEAHPDERIDRLAPSDGVVSIAPRRSSTGSR